MHNDADQTVHGVGRVYDGIDLFPNRKRDFAGRPAACNWGECGYHCCVGNSWICSAVLSNEISAGAKWVRLMNTLATRRCGCWFSCHLDRLRFQLRSCRWRQRLNHSGVLQGSSVISLWDLLFSQDNSQTSRQMQISRKSKCHYKYRKYNSYGWGFRSLVCGGLTWGHN